MDSEPESVSEIVQTLNQYSAVLQGMALYTLAAKLYLPQMYTGQPCHWSAITWFQDKPSDFGGEHTQHVTDSGYTWDIPFSCAVVLPSPFSISLSAVTSLRHSN